MTNPVAEVKEVEVKEEKRARRAFPKNQTTVGEIIEGLEALKKEVAELDEAIASVPEGNALFNLAVKELNSKRKELEDALDTVYYF